MPYLKLQIVGGPGHGVHVILQAPERICVGRASASHIGFTVHDPTMSREHFEISLKNGNCQIRDLNSRNGTQVNGQPIQAAETVRDSDQITAGSTRFLVQFPSDEGANQQSALSRAASTNGSRDPARAESRRTHEI